MNERRYSIGVAIVVAALGAVPARADVIFNNFGPNNASNAFTGYTVGFFPDPGFLGTVSSMGFTIAPGQDYRLSRIEFAAWFNFGSPNAYTVTLRTDANNTPGAVLETFNFQNLGPFNANTPVTGADSALFPLLQAGQQYWLTMSIVSGDTTIAWNMNSIGDIGRVYQFRNGSVLTDTTGLRAAFRILGDEADTTIPEPASVTLLAIVLGLFGCARHVRRRAA